MKILITSGGTKVPLDPVRDITNMSQGTLGSELAVEFLAEGHQVDFFHAKHSKTPFKLEIEADKMDWKTAFNKLLGVYYFLDKKSNYYNPITYRNYEDYTKTIEKLITQNKYDMIILAAAVSDYIPEEVSDKKIKSNEELTIKLKQASKIISKVKEWSPTSFLVGFKLLVGETSLDLIDACQQSIKTNQCDCVVGNQWDHQSTKNRLRSWTLVSNNGSFLSQDLFSPCDLVNELKIQYDKKTSGN